MTRHRSAMGRGHGVGDMGAVGCQGVRVTPGSPLSPGRPFPTLGSAPPCPGVPQGATRARGPLLSPLHTWGGAQGPPCHLQGPPGGPKLGSLRGFQGLGTHLGVAGGMPWGARGGTLTPRAPAGIEPQGNVVLKPAQFTVETLEAGVGEVLVYVEDPEGHTEEVTGGDARVPGSPQNHPGGGPQLSGSVSHPPLPFWGFPPSSPGQGGPQQRQEENLQRHLRAQGRGAAQGEHPQHTCLGVVVAPRTQDQHPERCWGSPEGAPLGSPGVLHWGSLGEPH